MQAALASGEVPAALTEPALEAPARPLALTDEQVMVNNTIQRFFAHRLDESELGRGPLTTGHWRELAALGVLAALLPDRAGGLGGSPRQAALVAEQFGRALAISPLAEGVVAAAVLVARYGDEALVERWAGPTLEGQRHLAWARGRIEIQADGDLSGVLPLVRWAGQADALVVPATEAAYLVPTQGPGVTMRSRALIDGTPVATVHLFRARGQRIDLPPGAAALTQAEAQLCYVAEMVGAMAVLHRQTAGYTQQRRQFGAAIGSFQAVQHKLARMFVLLEQGRSWLLRASLCDRDDPAFVNTIAAAKAYVADAAQRLAEDAVQLHGGIGITDDLVVARGLRRITVLARLFGNAEDARGKLLS